MDQKTKPALSSLLKTALIRSSYLIMLFLLLYSCKKENVVSEPQEQKIAQIVFTSDLHYGLTRTFRGVPNVDAGIVNKELIKQINTLPTIAFPSDDGLNAGKAIGYIDYMVITGDITTREVAPVQSATASWAQFNTDYLNGITLKNQIGRKTEFLLTPGNHDVSNAIGYTKTMIPSTDNSALVNIYNYMYNPSSFKTKTTYNYNNDKINYSTDIFGVHLMFINMWPDSTAQIWMQKDLAAVSSTTPAIIFTHDQPECEAKHFTNPNGTHNINSTDKFENMVPERLKDGKTISSPTILEQKKMVAFLKSYPNIKAYFHGNDNSNEFYVYKGPDNDINLNTFRVDSPMKGTITGIDAPDGKGDETKLSFQVIVIDNNSKTLTVRQCLWNTNGSASPLTWGISSTISLD
jgi:predicted MPP superfamily phosphohydrolase